MQFALMNQELLMRAGLFPHALSSRDNEAMIVHICTMSVTTSMDNIAPRLSQQRKGTFLFSTATATLHVNNSIVDFEDVIVKNPPTCL